MGTLASGSIDLNSLMIAGEPNKYITTINNNGIKVKSQDPLNYITIDAYGMNVYRNNFSISSFGSTIRLGSNSGFRTEIDSDTFLITNGTVELAYIGYEQKNIVDTFVSDGNTTTFTLGETPREDGTVFPSSVSVSRSGIILTVNSGLPAAGESFTYSYIPSSAIPYYTMGKRSTGADSGYGKYSFAEGLYTTASGAYSHAEGELTTASASGSHAEGIQTKAIGQRSHAEGSGTTATGYASHAEGFGSEATGYVSHAEGITCHASGSASHASGDNTTAGYNKQTVIGEWNDNKAVNAFEIGNGAGNYVSNAFEVDWDGNVTASGHFYGLQNILWSGGYYMTSTHTASLSENVSDQSNGIVLLWSAYVSGEVKDYHWISYFIPKTFVSTKVGAGVCIPLVSSNFNYIGMKYVYVYDDLIAGNDDNTVTGTKNGVTFANNHWVLRYVIGV